MLKRLFLLYISKHLWDYGVEMGWEALFLLSLGLLLAMSPSGDSQ